MTLFRIVAARPKNVTTHVNSEFKLYEHNDKTGSWTHRWVSIAEVGDLLRAGNDVRTGKIVNKKMKTGAAVEIELRITKNDTDYKISDMPDV